MNKTVNNITRVIRQSAIAPRLPSRQQVGYACAIIDGVERIERRCRDARWQHLVHTITRKELS